MEPVFFSSPAALRTWFKKNHEREKELLVGYWKVGSGKPSLSWSESVDEALCFGWIDGVRKSIDRERYMIRFTPRKPGSIWSAINIRKMETLQQEGKMTEAGLEAFSKRKDHKSAIYSYEKEPVALSKEFEKRFRSNKKAWSSFGAMPPSYRRTAIHWVMSAKQEATRVKRMETLISDSEAGERIKPLRY